MAVGVLAHSAENLIGSVWGSRAVAQLISMWPREPPRGFWGVRTSLSRQAHSL